MSNPSGTAPEDGPAAATADSDPATEIIEMPEGAASDRRYTAPGFDAGSTQIIDRVPDGTGFMGAPTEAIEAAPQERTATPQAILPRTPRRASWRLPIVLAIAALAAAGVVGFVLFKRAEASTAREKAVRSTIETFDAALREGDLATLRTVTCGQTHDTYANYDENAWADTFERVSAAKQYPVVASIDEVVIDGNHAEANVTSYMAFDPGTTSTRSFDLQYRDDQWKICQSS